MRRKIFICFFVVLLMTTLVVPAFASSDAAGSSSTSVNPAIPIDYIELLDGTHMGAIADWPNNYGKGTIDLSCSYPFADFRCERSGIGSSDVRFNTSVYVGDTSTVRLFCSNIFLATDVLFELNDNGMDHVVFTNVSVTGSYHLPYKDNNGGYAISSSSFSKTASYDSGFVDLYELLISAAQSGYILPNGVLWLQDVTITLSFYFNDSDSDHYFNVSVSNSKFYNSFEYWFNAYKLTYTVSSGSSGSSNAELPNLFDWLLDSVNAFLNFEIAPDFTLNKLFFIVLVIGVLLWFVKLLS